jgi:branched-chain amino acid transport system permease protein
MLQQLLVNGLIAGGIYALVALGFSVIYRTVKFFHFAHGAVYTAGAYFGYTLAIQLKRKVPGKYIPLRIVVASNRAVKQRA